MPAPGDKAIITCRSCGDAFAGIYTEEDKLTPLGGSECHNCGEREFEELKVTS